MGGANSHITRNRPDFSFKGVDPLDWLKVYKIRTILDVGANEGQFAEKMLAVCPEATIHCFEPLKDAFENLSVKFSGKKNLIAHNFGLGSASEDKIIHCNEYSPSSSMLEMLELHKSNFDFAVKVEEKTISIKRLDDCFLDQLAKPLLLKIDVQGYEMHVLEGGERTAKQADVIIIETTFRPLYKGQPLFEDIFNWMTQRGFSFAGNLEQLMAPLDNAILQADAIFVKK
jgi:FkbM family methyltransferase